MPSLHVISSCLQHLVESPISNHRARRSKRRQKSSKTTTNCIPFSPRKAFLEPIDFDRDTNPLLSTSHSSMLSAVTTTGAYSLTNTPSLLSSLSFAKSESRLPFLPHPNLAKSDKSNCDRQSEAVPFVNVQEPVSHRLPKLLLPVPPHLTERDSIAPTAFMSSPQPPNSASGSRVGKDDHEIYLDNLRLLRFGDDSLSDGFSLPQNDDDDAESWQEVNLRDYGWEG